MSEKKKKKNESGFQDFSLAAIFFVVLTATPFVRIAGDLSGISRVPEEGNKAQLAGIRRTKKMLNPQTLRAHM